MLDLGKSYGEFEGITFFGDHEQEELIYYFPNEVKLSKIGDEYELDLQIFKEGRIIVDGDQKLEDSSGAILSLGVVCTIGKERLNKASFQLASKLGLDFTEIRWTTPTWKSGTVDLLVLDATTQEESTEDSFVKAIHGSKSPTLIGGDLKSIFNVRLDQRGANLLATGLLGERDYQHIAGVIYNLKFEAIQPALDLRIRADLSRVRKTVSHIIEANVSYKGIVGVGAGLELIKRKLEENGDIQVEILSQVSDEKIRAQIRETVNRFKDKILDKLFEPAVLPQDIVKGILKQPDFQSGGKGSIVHVGYKLKKESEIQNRIIEVDYRERIAVTRDFNPQSHLWAMTEELDGTDYIQMVDTMELWNKNGVTISLLHDFEKPTSNEDLLTAEVVIWRKQDGIASEVKEGNFAIPKGKEVLASVTFSKNDHSDKLLSWTNEPDEPSGYFYQVRFTYSDEIDSEKSTAIDSLLDIMSLPQSSNSQDLVIIPQVLAPSHQLVIKPGASIDFDNLKGVEVNLRARNKLDEIVATEHFILNAPEDIFHYKVRRAPTEQIILEASKSFYFKDTVSPVKGEYAEVVQEDLPINDPLGLHQLKLLPLVIKSDTNILKLILEVSYIPAESKYRYYEIFHADGPSFQLPSEIIVKTLNEEAIIKWKASVITSIGNLIELDQGECQNNDKIIINLNQNQNRVLNIHWIGPSPENASLKYLKLDFRLRVDGDKENIEDIKFSGDTIPIPMKYTYPPEGDLEMRIVRSYKNGQRKKDSYKKVISKEIVVQP